MLANDLRIMSKLKKKYVEKLIESVAVIKVAIDVKRVELMSLLQHHDEPFRTFVCSEAKTCNFTTVSKCKCGSGIGQVTQKEQ